MAGGTPRLRPFYASRGGVELRGYSVVPAAAGPCELVGVTGVDRDMHALQPRLFRASRGGGEVTRQAARPGRGRSALAGAGKAAWQAGRSSSGRSAAAGAGGRGTRKPVRLAVAVLR